MAAAQAAVQLQHIPPSFRLDAPPRRNDAFYHFKANNTNLPPQSQSAYLALRTPASHKPSNKSFPGPQELHSASDNFLRRKTPTGTITGAYNGSYAELDHQPRPAKYQSLPGLTSLPNTAAWSNESRSWPQQSPASLLTPPYTANYNFEPSLNNTHNTQKPWNDNSALEVSHAQPRLDFMLNNQGLPYGMMDWQYTHTSGPRVMQPPYSPALGPTASNEHAPYGPYWPDGQFAPYQPAQFQPSAFVPWQSDRMASNALYPGSSGQFAGLTDPARSSANNLSWSGFLGNDSFGTSAHSALQRGSQHVNHTQDSSGGHLKTFPNVQNQSQFDQVSRRDQSGQNPSFGIPGEVQNINNATQGPSPSYAQRSPAEVFAWASTIYANLQKAIQKARKQQDSSSKRQTAQRSSSYLRQQQQQQPAYGSRSQSYDVDQYGLNGRATTHTKKYHQAVHGTANLSLGGPSPNQGYASDAKDSRLDGFGRRAGLDPSQKSSGIQRHQTGFPPGSEMITHSQVSSWPSVADLRGAAYDAVQALNNLCTQSTGGWIDGMLLNGCLSYTLGEHQNAIQWYLRILELQKNHVEATANLAAAYLALNRRREAEDYWRHAIRLKPTFFEAAEHLIGLLCFDKRHKEAVQVIDHIQAVLKAKAKLESNPQYAFAQRAHTSTHMPTLPTMSTCRYASPGCDNGRLMGLVHNKGNIMYNMHDHLGAARAFEEVVLIAVGYTQGGIDDLIKLVVTAISGYHAHGQTSQNPPYNDCLFLSPEKALQTRKICFPGQDGLPGLEMITNSASKEAATSVTSNSLLSLAKIFQDGMNPNTNGSVGVKSNYTIREILALYYLSLSLQPSPSTANNVGILLASVQPAAPTKAAPQPSNNNSITFAGVAPGSGVALALTYYQYGLNLDPNHAHLYTNLGSLLKDINQLPYAIQMYEKAVHCDPNFDIALANLANAVKDQGKVSEAIRYYRRAVQVNSNFAEAVCGLANALNSVCEWAGRGGVKLMDGKFDQWHVDESGQLKASFLSESNGSGWINRVVDIVNRQLSDGQDWGHGAITDKYIDQLASQLARAGFGTSHEGTKMALKEMMHGWKGRKWEGARIVWLVERATRQIAQTWYHDKYTRRSELPTAYYSRPQLPDNMSIPGAPTVLPFHTFTLPMTAKQVRMISQRNGLRVSCSTLRSPWLPKTLFPPPSPPAPQLRIGYVSSDFNNHPLAHLMQSVFGMHDKRHIKAFCYATTASDGSRHRRQIEREAPSFVDASTWSVEKLVQQIVRDEIHILINLNGYTRGARNEVFAARAAPIQMSFMGFAGTLGAEWCDYLLADETAVPAKSLRPHRSNVDVQDLIMSDNAGNGPDAEDWVYAENIIYSRDTFFCNDHRQSACADPAAERKMTWADEQARRWKMRKELFPDLPDDAVILGNFNQLYKIDPTTFRTWLKILSRLPNAYLWLLRFPADGATHLLQTATQWAGSAVASRIRFTDVAAKQTHILRACVADLFLDTPECNAHTTAADCLWSGTPLLTLPRYEWKMCSRMAAGILGGALPRDTPAGRAAWDELVATSEEQYEETAVRLARDLSYAAAKDGVGAQGRLVELRRMIWQGRWSCKLFDTRRWVKDLEVAYWEAWRRWLVGEGGDIYLKDLIK